jgi:hypothetical protein
VAAAKKSPGRPAPVKAVPRPAKGSGTKQPAPAPRRAKRLTDLDLNPLGKIDALAAALVTLAAGTVYATTLSSHIAWGDSAESVAGVKDVGVLHAPGYPVYVLAARAFGTVFAVGGWAFRVNLFSLVSAALMVGVVYLLARAFSANVLGAVVGALALGVSASFWHNATFAKHYAFSGLLIATAALLVVLWRVHRRTWLLVAGGGVFGAATGGAWELAMIMVLGAVIFLWLCPRRPAGKVVLGAVGAFAAVAAVVWTFLLVRARQDPTINWGYVTDAGRFIDLVTHSDFRGGQSQYASGSIASRVPARSGAAFGGFVRDLGYGAAALAIVGAVAAYVRRIGSARIAMLSVVFVLNVVSVVWFAGVERINGFFSAVVSGAYLLDAMIVLAVLIALGAGWISEWVAQQVSDPGTRTLALGGTAVVLVAAVVLPSLITHRVQANHDIPPLADSYAAQVFDALPENAALIVYGEEYSMPMIYRQVVHGERPDVDVISANALGNEWTRDQLTKRLDLGDTLQPGPIEMNVQNLIAKLRETRPVYFDTTAMGSLRNFAGYHLDGLVAETSEGSGPQKLDDTDAMAETLERLDREGFVDTQAYNRNAYRNSYWFHELAHIQLAKAMMIDDDREGAIEQLQIAADMFEDDKEVRAVLEQVRNGSPDAFDLVQNL